METGGVKKKSGWREEKDAMIRGKLPGNVEDTERRSKKFRLFKEVCFL